MLHELLLALTGHTSPLLDHTKGHALTAILSPSEKTLLRSLAILGDLQAKTRTQCSNISSTHSSTICRAVCASIVNTHLSAFNDKVVDIEAGILRNDTQYVGAYDIVPLSTLVAAFDGWDRVLRWFDRFVSRMNTDTKKNAEATAFTTGAQVIDYLKDEVHTGYPEIEQVATALLTVAEATWVRQLTPWLLYGKLPPYGTEDFFIQNLDSIQDQTNAESFVVDQSLAPFFLDSEVAHSILFIGRSLQHIQRGHAKLSAIATADLDSARRVVLKEHLALLQSLELPLTTFTVRQMVRTMRSSLSKNALQKLLPFSDIIRLLDVLRQFFLLERGEFAVALIGAADECLAGRHLKTGSHKDRMRLGGMMIKDGEVSSVLSRAWASLVARQDVNEEDEDDDLEYGREVIELSIRRQVDESRLTPSTTPVSRLENRASLFDDVLLATPTTLTLTLSSPLDIFLSEQDVQDYSLVHSYLVAIRRAHLHLAELWKLSTLRRIHPTPVARRKIDSVTADRARNRTNDRLAKMRSVWAAISHARVFFAQMNDYFQGEVVQGCTETLERWINPKDDQLSRSRPNTGPGIQTGTNTHSRIEHVPQAVAGASTNPETSDLSSRRLHDVAFEDSKKRRHDPEALATAHRAYLSRLKDSLLLNETRFVTSIRNLMTRIDHAVALTQRLAVVTQITQLGEQATPGESQSSHAKEEYDLMRSLESVRKSINSNLEDLLRSLRDLDDRRRMGILPSQRAAESAEVDGMDSRIMDRDGFMPWQGPGLSRLLLRLE